MTFVDETGFKCKPRKLGAANVDIVLRFALELRDHFGVEGPLEARVARCDTVRVREKTIFSALCQTCAKSRCSGE